MANVIVNQTRNSTSSKGTSQPVINHDLVKSVKLRIAHKTGDISHDELAEAIASDKYLFFNFLLDNNPTNIANTLKNIIGENLDFKPSRNQLEAIISSYIEKDNFGKLQAIIDNFRPNPNAGNYTNYPELHKFLIQKLPK